MDFLPEQSKFTSMQVDDTRPTKETSSEKARYFNDMLTWIENIYAQVSVRINLLMSGLTLLGSETVTLTNGAAKSTVFTFPGEGIVSLVIIRNPSASLANGTNFSIGSGASANTWRTSVNLSSLTTALTDYIILQPPTTRMTIEASGSEFGILPVTGSTAIATATMEVYGKFF
jgi:hypothetical protein